MKGIVVTGASGVVGGALLRRLSGEPEMDIIALSRSNMSGTGPEGVSWKVTDYSVKSLTELLEGAYAVIHLAGTNGTKEDLSDYDGDLAMTDNLLKASAECGVERFIYASSRLVYGNPDNIPWTEETAPEPRSAYGVNKIRCEELCRSYSGKSGMNITAVRIAQVLSETGQMRNMVNVFRDLAREGKELTVTERSEAVRQYIYAGDLAEIFFRLISADVDGFSIVNAGMDKAYTNLQIAQAFNRAYGNSIPVRYDDSKPETITSSVMDVEKMKRLTGWVPGDMDETLRRMADSRI